MWKKLGVLLILIGGFLIGFEFYKNYETTKKQDDLVSMFLKQAEQVADPNNTEVTSSSPQDLEFTSNMDSIIMIPSVMDKPLPILKNGNDPKVLEIAPGLISDLPLGEGNYSVAGHNTNYKKVHFSAIHNVKAGDLAYVTARDGKVYVFKLDTPFKVPADDISVLNHTDVAELTLITCEKPSDNGIRVIVKGELVEIQDTH